MARIRSVKPEVFRHEGLQDLQISHPHSNVILVFIALWGHCDNRGRFEWKPRTLKLDILPFLDFDLASTLDLLAQEGFVQRYEVDGKLYGEVVSFGKHQRISGKEAQDGERFPKNPGDSTYKTKGELSGKHSRSEREAIEKQPESQEGKGKEGKGDMVALFPDCASDEEQKSEAAGSFDWTKAPAGVDSTHWRDWMKVRKDKKASNTDSAWRAFDRECEKAGYSINEGVRICAEKGWKGFDAEWIAKDTKPAQASGPSSHGQRELEATMERLRKTDDDPVCPPRKAKVAS